MITNQKDLRRAFWQSYAPHGLRVPKPRGKDWPVDVSVLFVDYVDRMARDGTISEALAQRATLSP